MERGPVLPVVATGRGSDNQTRMVEQVFITLSPYSRGYHLVTSEILEHLPKLPENGLVNIFMRHTSAGITLNENADSTVRMDFETILNKIVPEDFSYRHTMEGTDDMPAHVKASIIGQSVTIPIHQGRLLLGTWQGVYLCEFRNNGGRRNLVVTIYS